MAFVLPLSFLLMDVREMGCVVVLSVTIVVVLVFYDVGLVVVGTNSAASAMGAVFMVCSLHSDSGIGRRRQLLEGTEKIFEEQTHKRTIKQNIKKQCVSVTHLLGVFCFACFGDATFLQEYDMILLMS